MPIRLKNITNWPVVIILLLIVCVATYSIWYLNNHKIQNKKNQPKPIVLKDYKNDQFGFKLKYPKDFIVVTINEETNKTDPIMLKLVRTDPPTLVLFWQEKLGIVASTIKQPLLEYLKNNIDRKYGTDFNDFKKIKIFDTKMGNIDGFSIMFTFQDNNKIYREKIKQFIIVKNNNGYYLQCLAPVEQWTLAETACDQIKTSLKFIK